MEMIKGTVSIYLIFSQQIRRLKPEGGYINLALSSAFTNITKPIELNHLL